MDEVKVKVAGGVTYWASTEWYSRSNLIIEWSQAGFGGLVPAPTTPLESLKYAVRKAAGGHNFLARKRAGNSMAIVREVVDGREASYHDELICYVEGEEIKFDNILHPMVGGIHTAYYIARQRIPGKKVTSSLTTIAGRLHATTLRPRGGVYWLPESSLPAWRHIARGLKRASLSGPSQIYLLTTAMTPATANAVVDAVKRNIASRLLAIHKEMDDPKLGDRGRKTKLAEIKDLAAKADLYSELWNRSLTDLKAATAATGGDELEALLGDMFG